jgi:predicted dienelactone hydrolase
MLDQISHDRRRFLRTAGMAVAAAQFAMVGSADARSGKTKPTDLPPIKPGTNTSFGSLKQINAGVLNVGYAEVGPADGPVIILLHGWPYDIYSYADVAPQLASVGYRVIVPYRPLSARLWVDALPFECNIQEWPASGGRCRYRRPDGCTRNQAANPRWF